MVERRMFNEVLRRFRDGQIDEDSAAARIVELFYTGQEHFLLDLEREQRLGFPEVVYAEGKQTDDLVEIVGKLLACKGIAYIAGLNAKIEASLLETYQSYRICRGGRAMVIGMSADTPSRLGVAGVITAGTSDIPYAEECVLFLDELGATVIRSYDAGVAGIHRPIMSLQKMRQASVLIVFAGMEGALPTVLASLTELPVIAVPTPIGYGFGGRGEAALATMLQSCSPGVTVVNIGNSVGAAAAAIRILRAVHRCSNDQA